MYAVVFSRYIKTPGCINTDDLDVIVREGDKLYKSLNTDTHLEFSDLPNSITTFGFKANISYLSNSIGLLNPGQNESFLLQNKHCNFQPGDGMLFIVKGYCICLIIRKNTVFLFDSHSRNERGKPCPDGFSMIAKFKNKRDVEKYILNTYIKSADSDVQYEFQSIGLEKINIEPTTIDSFKKFTKEKAKSVKNSNSEKI